MQGQQGHYQYTPTDLLEFFRSPFAAWMSRFHHDFPGHVQPDADPPALLSLAFAGERHEQQVLAQFHADTHDVREIPATADRVTLTRIAMQAGHAVIYHGALAADASWG